MRVVAALVALPALAAAAPVERYGEAVPVPKRSPLVQRVVLQVRQAARRGGQMVPECEPRLEAALATLLPLLGSGAPPPSELVTSALRLHGLVEPPPHLLIVAADDGDEAGLAAELEARLPSILAQGRYRRLGVVAAPGAGGRVRLLIALLESFVELEPVARQLPPGGRLLLDGKILPPYGRAQLFVTSPDGAVQKLVPAQAKARFRGAFHCRANGTYQVEVTAEDRFGPAVLANFPLHCGIPAPQAVTVPPAPERPWTPEAGVAAAEQRIRDLIDGERRRAGLAPLLDDPRLSEIARSHCQDMMAHGFVGHVSPSTGAADDRLRRAGLAPMVVRENVGRAYSPEEAQRGFMDSPGHRGNLLAVDVDRLGIAVTVGELVGGSRELFVTQLFARLPAPFDAAAAPEVVRRRIAQLRAAEKRPPLVEDRELDQLAGETARALGNGDLPVDQAGRPAERAVGRFADRYRSLRTVVLSTQELSQIGPSRSFLDERVSHAGFGIAETKPDAGGRHLVVVLVLGVPR